MTGEICIVCLSESVDLETNYLIQYNHCGNYYIHRKCLELWEDKHTECIICRKNLFDLSVNSSDNHREEFHNVEVALGSRNTDNIIQVYPRPIIYDNCQLAMFGIGVIIIFVGTLTITCKIIDT
jgi:hypothetical protein